MSWPGWAWFQDGLLRQGVELEEVEEVEGALDRREAPGSEESWQELSGHPALRRIRGRIGNRALAELVREAARRTEVGPEPIPSSGGEATAAEDVPASASGPPDPRGGPVVEKAPALRSPEPEVATGPLGPPGGARTRGGPGAGQVATSARDPVRLLTARLRSVLATLPRGFVARAWNELLDAWPEAPSVARDRAVRALRGAILGLPAEARKELAEALERLGPVPGVDLLPRLRSALAVPPSGGSPPPPPPPDDGG